MTLGTQQNAEIAGEEHAEAMELGAVAVEMEVRKLKDAGIAEHKAELASQMVIIVLGTHAQEKVFALLEHQAQQDAQAASQKHAKAIASGIHAQVQAPALQARLNV